MLKRGAELGAFLNRWPRRLAALACLLLAGASVLTVRQPRAASAVPATAVVTAARAIPAGTDLVVADLRVSTWPRDLVPTGTVPNPRQLLGKRVGSAVARGEPITAARLVGADLASGLPLGKVAVPVSLADPNAAALIRAGDRVDLLVGPADGELSSTALPGAATATSTGAITVASRAQVLAILTPRPGADTGTEIIVATDRATSLRIAMLANRPILAVRDDHP